MSGSASARAAVSSASASFTGRENAAIFVGAIGILAKVDEKMFGFVSFQILHTILLDFKLSMLGGRGGWG